MNEGDSLNDQSLDGVLKALRGALVFELKKRGLWNLSPRYLGVFGSSHWEIGGSLEDLVFDCYEFIFIRRLPGLSRQLEKRSNIDGLIFLNIRHFVHETQRRHDPLGFRIYEIVRSAVEGLVVANELHVLSGEVTLRNDTVLGFAPWFRSDPAKDTEFQTNVSAWCDDLMPELVTAWNKNAVVSRLSQLIAGLADDGLQVFKLGDILVPLKAEVRGRWSSLFVESLGEVVVERAGDSTEWIRLIPPDQELENWQDFQSLVSCISKRLGRLEKPRKTQDYLFRLFQFMRQWATESETERFSGEDERPKEEKGNSGNLLPSDKRLGELLGIPRARLKDLRTILGNLVDGCKRGELGALASTALTRPERRRSLSIKTAQAAAIVAESQRIPTRLGVDPRPGDIYQLPFRTEVPVDWLVLEIVSGFSSLVAVDDRPLVGSCDLQEEFDCFRCDQEIRVPLQLLEHGKRIGSLGSEAGQRVREKYESIINGDVRAGVLAWEVDSDPEYLWWTKQLETARGLLNAESSLATEQSWPNPQSKEPGFSRSLGYWSYGLAATFAAGALGLSFWNLELHRKVGLLSEPSVIRSSDAQEIRFRDPDRGLDLRVEITENHLMIYLVLSQLETFPNYRLELLEQEDERPVWQSSLIERDQEVLLTWHRLGLDSQRYRLRIYGQESVGESLLDEQSFSVEVRP